MRRTLPKACKIIFYSSLAIVLAFAWFGFLNIVIEHGQWMHSWNGNARYADLLEHGAVHGAASPTAPAAVASPPDSIANPLPVVSEPAMSSGEVPPGVYEPSAPHPTLDSDATPEAAAHNQQSYQAGESFRLYNDEQISLVADDAVPPVAPPAFPAPSIRTPAYQPTFHSPALDAPSVVAPPFQLPAAPAPAFQLPAAPACCTP